MKLRSLIVLVFAILLTSFSAEATVRFGVGVQWLGNTDMAVGFDIGGGSRTFGIDVAHYGMQPTLYSYGTVELNQNRIGIYYLPWDFLMIETGVHDTKLNLSQSKQEILGTTRSSVWSGAYLMLSVPLRIEETYFVKPFYGVYMVEGGVRSEVAWGVALGADFEPQENKILF